MMAVRPTQSTDKRALRAMLRARRKAVDPDTRRAAGRMLPRLALRHHLLARGRRIGFYVPANSEIDVMPLLRRAQAMGVECYLPVVPGRGKRKLWFSRLGDKPAWVVNRYGIPEYRHRPARRIRATQLDVLFMPLLGFDRLGGRLGMGGGHYDASLAHLRARSHWRKPHLVGVAFSVQAIERVPRESWDIPLDHILTELDYRARLRKAQ